MNLELAMNTLSKWFSFRSSREQWLLLFSGLAVTLGLGFLLIIEPQTNTLVQQEQALSRVDDNVSSVDTFIAEQQRVLSLDPDAEIKQTLRSLREQTTQLDTQLRQQVAGLVTSDQMADLMEQVLKHSGKLSLLSLDTLPAEQLSQQQNSYYLHPVQMRLRGKYFDIVDYLRRLEALPAKYYWRSVNYHVTDYPWAEVDIQVYTLGESRVFIGG